MLLESPLTQGRELKFKDYLFRIDRFPVAPRAGARVEMILALTILSRVTGCPAGHAGNVINRNGYRKDAKLVHRDLHHARRIHSIKEIVPFLLRQRLIFYEFVCHLIDVPAEFCSHPLWNGEQIQKILLQLPFRNDGLALCYRLGFLLFL